ncbi:MAG: hypothetical protein U0Y68_06185 [Blastocatellia bacterium]
MAYDHSAAGMALGLSAATPFEGDRYTYRRNTSKVELQFDGGRLLKKFSVVITTEVKTISNVATEMARKMAW